MQVEIEVPQACSFVIRTTGCQLSEVVDMDAAGNPVFGPSATSDIFATDMERWRKSLNLFWWSVFLGCFLKLNK